MSEQPSMDRLQERRRHEAELLAERRRLRRQTEEARQEFEATKGSIRETWERLVRSRDGAALDRNFRRAALNLLEDTELAWRNEEAEAAGRERAEAAERASEARLQLALDAVGMATFTWHPREDRSEPDARMLALFGLRPGARLTLADALEHMLHPDDRAPYTAAVARAIDPRGHGRLNAEIRVIHPDASQHWIAITGQTVFEGEPPEPTRMYGIAADISERMQAAEALRASEQRLRTLADAVPQVIWTNSGNGTADYFNRRWYEYTGLSFEQSAGLGWEAVVHDDDAPGSVERWRKALVAGEVFDTEYRLRGADGSYRWFIGRNVPMRDETGRVSAWFGTATDIHDLKEATAAVQASEEQFRRAIEEAPIPVIMHAEDGQVLQISRTWTALTGYEAADIPTFDAWLNRAYGAGADAVREHMHQLFRGEVAQLEVEIEVKTRAGDRRCWAFSASAPGTLRDGRRFIVGMALDISERQAAERLARESEERVRIAVESAKMGTWEWDLPEHQVTWNDLHFTLLGMEPRPNPIPESAFFDRVHPEDRAELTEQIRRSAADHAAFEATFRIITEQGEERWMNGYGRVTREQEGEAVQMSGVMLDITERRADVMALRESEERLRLVVENAREYAIFSMDLDRRITSWNRGAVVILQYTPEEAIGQVGDIIFTPEDRATHGPEQEAQTAITQGRAADERWHLRKDGSRFWGSGVMMAMHDAEGRAIGLVKVFRDHTEQLRAKEALENSREELWKALNEADRARGQAEAAGKAKDHFLAVLSHELRTPLTPVLMATQTLERRKDLPIRAQEALAMIRRNIQIESRFVDELLDITKIERGKLELLREPMDVHVAIQHAVGVSRPDIEAKAQRLTVALQAREHRLHGDFSRLQQVVWNLLKNASKFTPQGGGIRLQTRNETGTLVIEIIDSGIGIAPEAAARIFDPFTQADVAITREYGGLGLGLAIAKASVLGHGGEIRVESRGAGHGATFIVALPLAVGEEPE